jgi:hypothetical protein
MYTQLQRLESATEMEILRRYELAARLDRPDGTPWSGDERQKLEKEVDLCEARRQALVLLLLHYSSGLQNVEETERDSKLCDWLIFLFYFLFFIYLMRAWVVLTALKRDRPFSLFFFSVRKH